LIEIDDRLRARVVDLRLRRGQARDRHAEGRAADVVHAGEVAELDRVRLAAVLAADADLEVGLGRAPLLDTGLDQDADRFAVEDLEGVDRAFTREVNKLFIRGLILIAIILGGFAAITFLGVRALKRERGN